MNDCHTPTFDDDIKHLINHSKVFSGGTRHYELVGDLLPPNHKWINITIPLERVYDEYRKVNEHIVVFASGDPLFFGYTTTLMRVFPGKVKITYPTFNSLQMLCHAITLPYHDMRVVSLTGRPWHEFDRAVIERTKKLGILTDKKHTPQTIAQRLIDYGYTYYDMYIGVRLGGERQETYKLPLDKVVEKDFAHPNCVILQANRDIPKTSLFGIPDLSFYPLNGRVNMITKMPIRLLSLSMMDLPDADVMWDVGFCTGSVSIEAKLRFPHLHIYSFEIRKEGYELMNINSKRFGALGIDYQISDFLDVNLDTIPRPDSVFIGGHGGKVVEFVEKIIQYINPNGCIVFNSVKKETLDGFEEAIQKVGWQIIQRTHIALNEFNPITILKAKASK